MQPTSVSPLSSCNYPIHKQLYYPIPKQLYSHYQKSSILSPTSTTTKTRRSSTSLCSHVNESHTQLKLIHSTSSTSTINNFQPDTNIYDHKHLFIDSMYSLFGDNNAKKNDQFDRPSSSLKIEASKSRSHTVISSNMWWGKLKAKLGQSFNLEGIVSALVVMTRDHHLAIPHISVKDIRWIDWAELERRGFRGVVFDKDNTLTCPYSLQLWPPLASSLSSCKAVFGDNVAVFSNSAGLLQYDADGSRARAIEESIGVHVIRHGTKKPAGGVTDIEKHFGCESSLLVMVGDRYFTDVVYGNRNGFLTILTEPLSLVEEPFVVKQVRKFEASLAKYWNGRGHKPKCHSLLPQATEGIKVPPPIWKGFEISLMPRELSLMEEVGFAEVVMKVPGSATVGLFGFVMEEVGGGSQIQPTCCLSCGAICPTVAT